MLLWLLAHTLFAGIYKWRVHHNTSQSHTFFALSCIDCLPWEKKLRIREADRVSACGPFHSIRLGLPLLLQCQFEADLLADHELICEGWWKRPVYLYY